MTKPRQNSSIWSCVRRRRNGKCRRANGARRKPSSPSCSKTGSSWHDGQPAPHTRFLIVPHPLSRSQLGLTHRRARFDVDDHGVRHLLAQPPLRADAEAIAYQQHADDQFRIDRGPARLAVEGPQLLAQTRQVYEPIDRTKQVIRWHVSLKAKAIEQRLLHHGPLAHHQPVSPSRRLLNQDLTTSSSPIFSTPSAESGTTAFGLITR